MVQVAGVGGVGGSDDGGTKPCPKRGTRYSYAMKKEILKFAEENTVEAAAKKYAVTETTIYEWRRAGKRRGTDTGDLANGSTESTKSTGSTESTAQEEDGDPKEVRDRQVLAMWRRDGAAWVSPPNAQAQGACGALRGSSTKGIIPSRLLPLLLP